MDQIDWKNPDAQAIFTLRIQRLGKIRRDPGMLKDLKVYYRENPWDFISDWGVTVDPRNVERGIPAVQPFILFPKQVEFVQWCFSLWRRQKSGICEKSRDMGISWCAIGLAVTLCLFYENMEIGFGSRKEEYVDQRGDPKTLFYKARMFATYVPREFRGTWDAQRNAPHMRVMFPETSSVIAGEAGDDIGRGDRKGIYFVDESAHLEHPEAADAALSNTTNCRIDVSSINGMANPFAQKRHGGKYPVFTAHWRDDPRKGDAWYKDMCDKYDPVVIAQEVDINYNASVEGMVIPAAWVQAAVDAHIKLGLQPEGGKFAALDVADRGIDKNAIAMRHGSVLTHAESWTGNQKKNGRDWDIYDTTEKAFEICDLFKWPGFSYDGDGLGASIRGDARKLNEDRKKYTPPRKALRVDMFRGSAKGDQLFNPEAFATGPNGQKLDRKNKDYFANYKAQCWWALRYRFQNTFRAVNGMPYDPAEIISLGKSFPEFARLLLELAQPVYLLDSAGRILIDKQPDGVASPNLADAVMMCFAPRRGLGSISDELLEAV